MKQHHSNNVEPTELATPTTPTTPTTPKTPAKPPKEKEEEEEEIIEIVRSPPQQPAIIPVQDFNLSALNELVALSNDTQSTVVLERNRATVTPAQERKERAENAFKMIHPSDLVNTLRLLDKNINTVSANMLNKIHGDPERPRLHSFRVTDYTRKTVSLFSRLPEPQEHITKWLPYAKGPALQAISRHMSTILMHSLERVVSMLVYKFCVREQAVCYCYPEKKFHGKYVIVVDDMDFDRDAPRYEGLNTLRVLFYDQELSDIPPRFHDKCHKLVDKIEKRRDEVLEQVQKLVLTEADIMPFLERSRRPFSEAPELMIENADAIEEFTRHMYD